MSKQEITHLLEEHGVKVTANRLLVAEALSDAGRPLSLTELEDEIGSMDKSSIFRSLMTSPCFYWKCESCVTVLSLE